MAKAKKQETNEVNEVETNVVFDVLGEIDGDNFQEAAPLATKRYRLVQFNNNEKIFELTAAEWGGSMIELLYSAVEIPHEERDISGYPFGSISIAPFAWRMIWEAKLPDGSKEYTDKPNFSNGKKWSSRYNILCLLKEAESLEPVVITVRGFNGERMYNSIQQGQARIRNVLKKIGRPQLPAYLFWMEMIPGKREMAGKEKKSAIFPPTVAAPILNGMTDRQLLDWLISCYVGHDIKDLFADNLFDEGQRWTIEKNAPILALEDGGNGTPALPSGLSVSIAADGSIVFPVLEKGRTKSWVDVGYSIPDLFESREAANQEFSNVMKLAKPMHGEEYTVWQRHLETLWADKTTLEEEVARELMNRR